MTAAEKGIFSNNNCLNNPITVFLFYSTQNVFIQKLDFLESPDTPMYNLNINYKIIILL